MARNVVTLARNMTEWMSDEISLGYDPLKHHPFDLRHVEVFRSVADFDQQRGAGAGGAAQAGLREIEPYATAPLYAGMRGEAAYAKALELLENRRAEESAAAPENDAGSEPPEASPPPAHAPVPAPLVDGAAVIAAGASWLSRFMIPSQ